MWPFQLRVPVLDRLTEPTVCDVAAVVTSPACVESPLSGLRGAAITLELLEHVAARAKKGSGLGSWLGPVGGDRVTTPTPAEAYRLIESLVLGSSITVSIGALEVELPMMRTSLQLAFGAPSADPVPEVVPRVLAGRIVRARATCTEGPLCYRELALGTGSRVRVRAVFETVLQPASHGYRSGAERRTIVRPDLGAILVRESLERSGW